MASTEIGHPIDVHGTRTTVNINTEQNDANATISIPHETWFRYLQDVGIEMSPAEFSQFADNDRKTKARNIAFGGYFFRDLYTLSEQVYDLMEGKRDSLFNRLPKKSQRTVVIHVIGKLIAGHRRKVTRAEMENDNLIMSEEYDSTTHFYVMSQEVLFDRLRGRYGVSTAAMMKITVDDKVRIAGLVITKAPLREYLSDLTGRSRGGDRQALDASRARRNAGLTLLHENFIDQTVTVTIPLKWFDNNTREKIDEFLGEGTYEEHGQFNPNNLSRIALPWTVKETTAIFNKLDKEYHATMDKYTIGAGGGPGGDANFAAWQQRDECHVVRYTNQPSSIYLSVVHSWDKEFGYPFVTYKDPLPRECAIDSAFDFSSPIDDEFDDDTGGNVVTTPTSTSIPGSALTSVSKTSTSRREKGITRALEELSERRQESNKMTENLLNFIQGQAMPFAAGGSVNLQAHEILEHISKTRKLLTEYSNDIKAQRDQKEVIKNSDQPIDDKKRKIHNLTSAIMDNKKMMATLNKTLKHQRLQLESVTKTGDDENGSTKDDDDVSSESGMSDS